MFMCLQTTKVEKEKHDLSLQITKVKKERHEVSLQILEKQTPTIQ